MRSLRLRDVPRRIAGRVMIPKKISTTLSQLPLALPAVPGERGRHPRRYRRGWRPRSPGTAGKASGSWLNVVEIFFGIITRPAIRRGTSRNLKDLMGELVAERRRDTAVENDASS